MPKSSLSLALKINMRHHSKFVVFALLVNLTGYTAAADLPQSAVAAPFGVQVGAKGSCDAFLKRLGSPPLTRVGGSDPSAISFEAKSPDSLFPNAKSISVFCIDGVARSVSLVVNRSLPSDLELADVLQGMTEKYGGSLVNVDGYGMFRARNADITVNAKPKMTWFTVYYVYRADETQEKDEAAEKSKQRRGAL